MKYDLLSNIETCEGSVASALNNSGPGLLYYSHLPVIIIAIFLGIFVLSKSKDKLTGVILFLLASTFSIWSILDLVTWLSYDSQKIMFTWSLLGIFNALFFIFTLYFVYVFIDKKDISLNKKISLAVLMMPILAMTPGKNNLSSFIFTDCAADDKYFLNYIYFLEILIFFWVLYVLISRFLTIKNKIEKYQILLLSIGVVLFLVSFFSTGLLAGYLIDLNLISGYGFEIYGLFGMTFFVGFLAFLIVRFHAFNIKLLGAQALIWTLIILVGSQFLYQADMPVSSLILTAVTLVLSSVAGFLVVRSVKKVDAQRELLDIANKNQQSLLHFITHQVKGYLTKSRNIFDGMVAGDYDQLSQKALDMAKHGFDSDTKGVETVMAILKASDLKSGKTAFTKTKTNISALVAEIVDSKKDAAVQKGLELSFEIEPNIETEVDQLQIKEVFKNLITNSILYTPKGTVHVVLKREQGKVKFSVVDTGVGLSEKDKSKLFTEGGKGEESSLVNVDSTGYGLYIAKQIVEQHEGTIGAHSEGKDKGAEFFVLLPGVK